MRHVFAETNWVVEYAAPKHLRMPAALDLAQRAGAGEITLHIPAICLTEARYPIRKKFQPRTPADSVRKYLSWAATIGTVSSSDASIVRRVLDTYERQVLDELGELDQFLGSLVGKPGIEIFPLNEAILDRVVSLSLQNMDLKPFDQAILAAVLVRAEALNAEGASELCFCELDADLRPWDRNGQRKEPLTSLYDSAHVWVYGDFSMQTPERRSTFPEG